MLTDLAPARADVATRAPETYDHIRAALAAEAAELERIIAVHTATSDEISDDVEADADEREQAALARARAIATAAAIAEALSRIDDGTYGACEECGESIAIARLQALPTTAHCIRCAGGHGR